MAIYICPHTKVNGHNPAVEEAENCAMRQYLCCCTSIQQVNAVERAEKLDGLPRFNHELFVCRCCATVSVYVLLH